MEVSVGKLPGPIRVDDYDALVLPGGVMSADTLRQNTAAVALAKDFIRSGKPVAAVCHGPQTLMETGLLKGRTITSFRVLQTDLRNAGANCVDQEVVHDGNLITSRKPADLDAFCKELIDALNI